mgnify:CR=1 FL=1
MKRVSKFVAIIAVIWVVGCGDPESHPGTDPFFSVSNNPVGNWEFTRLETQESVHWTVIAEQFEVDGERFYRVTPSTPDLLGMAFAVNELKRRVVKWVRTIEGNTHVGSNEIRRVEGESFILGVSSEDIDLFRLRRVSRVQARVKDKPEKYYKREEEGKLQVAVF